MRAEPIGRRKVERLILQLSFRQHCGGTCVSAIGLTRQDWSDVVAAALAAQLYPALFHSISRRDPTAFGQGDLDRRHFPPMRNFDYRSASQRGHLVSAVRAINVAGIEPRLACGARELWLEAPGWRYVEEIELLVPPGSFGKAGAAISSCGWEPVRALRASGYRTEQWWVHRGTSGYIALRGMGTNRAIERVLAQSGGEGASLISSTDGAVARLMPAPAHCLHAVACHHSAPASRGGTVAGLKPLYEFAACLIDMQPAEWAELRDTLAGHRELCSIFDLWHAIARRAFGLPQLPIPERPAGIHEPVRLVEIAGLYHIALEYGAGVSK